MFVQAVPPYDDKLGGFILSECQPSLPSSPTRLFSSAILPSLTSPAPPHLSPFLMNHARDGQQPSRPSSGHARSCRPRRRRCAESPDAVSPSQSGSGQISPASCSSLCRATLMSRDPSELSGKQSHLIRPALCIDQHFLSVWERSLRL